MKRSLMLLLAMFVLAGCRSPRPTINPFLGPTTVPPPGTGTAVPPPVNPPYYQGAPPAGSAPAYSPPPGTAPPPAGAYGFPQGAVSQTSGGVFASRALDGGRLSSALQAEDGVVDLDRQLALQQPSSANEDQRSSPEPELLARGNDMEQESPIRVPNEAESRARRRQLLASQTAAAEPSANAQPQPRNIRTAAYQEDGAVEPAQTAPLFAPPPFGSPRITAGVATSTEDRSFALPASMSYTRSGSVSSPTASVEPPQFAIPQEAVEITALPPKGTLASSPAPVVGSPVVGSPVVGSPVVGSPVVGSPVVGSPVVTSPFVVQSAPRIPSYAAVPAGAMLRPEAVGSPQPTAVAHIAEAAQSPDESNSTAKPVQPRSRYGRHSKYTWLTGKLEYSRSRGQWKLRYIPIDGDTDKYGGSVTIVNAEILEAYASGDYVAVEGSIVDAAAESHSFAPSYRVARIKPLAE